MPTQEQMLVQTMRSRFRINSIEPSVDFFPAKLGAPCRRADSWNRWSEGLRLDLAGSWLRALGRLHFEHAILQRCRGLGGLHLYRQRNGSKDFIRALFAVNGLALLGLFLHFSLAADDQPLRLHGHVQVFSVESRNFGFDVHEPIGLHHFDVNGVEQFSFCFKPILQVAPKPPIVFEDAESAVGDLVVNPIKALNQVVLRS